MVEKKPSRCTSHAFYETTTVATTLSTLAWTLWRAHRQRHRQQSRIFTTNTLSIQIEPLSHRQRMLIQQRAWHGYQTDILLSTCVANLLKLLQCKPTLSHDMRCAPVGAWSLRSPTSYGRSVDGVKAGQTSPYMPTGNDNAPRKAKARDASESPTISMAFINVFHQARLNHAGVTRA